MFLGTHESPIEGKPYYTLLIIGCSEYITEKIRRHFPQFASRCHTIYNGVDVSRFLGKNRTNFQKKSDGKRILFVGRISPEKRLYILLTAFKKVVQSCAQLSTPFEFIFKLSDKSYISDYPLFATKITFSAFKAKFPKS